MAASPHQQAPPPPPPPPQSSGKFWWLVLAIIAGGGGYSYSQGWLDRPIEAFLGARQAPAAPATVTTGESTPAAASPAPAAAGGSNEAMVSQFEALQSRLASQESTSRNMQSVIEEIAAQVVRQTGGAPGPSAQQSDIVDLRLEVIDLRLRLTGDTYAAIGALQELQQEGLDPESTAGTAVARNLERLTAIPPRSQVVDLIDRLDAQAGSALADVDRRLGELAAENQKASLDGGILNALFKVRKTDPGLVRERELALALAAEVPPARNALLLGAEGAYADSLARIQGAADALRNHNPTLQTTEIAEILTELTRHGYPRTHLDLTQQQQGESPG